MGEKIIQPPFYNSGFYDTGAGGDGEAVSGGLLYKGYFTSYAIGNEIDPSDDYIFNDSFKFRAINTKDRAILTVDNFNYNREDDVEISIDFVSDFSRIEYHLLGNMTSKWWRGLSSSIDADSGGQFIGINQGVNNQSDWGTQGKKAYFDFSPNTEYNLKYKHPKNTDKVQLRINGVLVAEQNASDPSKLFYGNTEKYGIGGIYNNNNSLLYQSNKNTYIKSTSYIKINGDFLPRP